jgi:ribosomal protein L21E
MKTRSQIGKMSRAKGARIERETVTRFQNAGIEAKRTALLQTNKDNDDSDVIVNLKTGETIKIEVKGRAKGTQFHRWLEGNDALVYRVDKQEPLVVIPFDSYIKLLGGNEDECESPDMGI